MFGLKKCLDKWVAVHYLILAGILVIGGVVSYLPSGLEGFFKPDKTQRRVRASQDEISQIIDRFPRLNSEDLRQLAELLEKREIKGEINLSIIDQVMEVITRLDEINDGLYQSGLKPESIRLIFVDGDFKNLGLHFDFSNKVLEFHIPKQVFFTSYWFKEQMFLGYVHKDGHLKAGLLRQDGQFVLTLQPEEWFERLAEGRLDSPYLELESFSIDFRVFLQKEFIRMQNEFYGKNSGVQFLFKHIMEVLTHKLLLFTSSPDYSQAFLGVLQEFYKRYTQEPQSYEYKIIHSPDFVDLRTGLLLLLDIFQKELYARIFQDINLATNFRLLAQRLIYTLEPTEDRDILWEEYQELMLAFWNLVFNITPEESFYLRLLGVESKIHNLWQSLRE